MKLLTATREMRKFWLKIPFALFAAYLLFESLFVKDNSFPRIFHISQDKGKHIVSAFILILAFHIGCKRIPVYLSFLFLTVASGGVEILQYIITHGKRHADIKDIYANAIGFFIGAVVLCTISFSKTLFQRTLSNCKVKTNRKKV